MTDEQSEPSSAADRNPLLKTIAEREVKNEKRKKMRMQSKMGQEKDYETALQKRRESVLKC